MSTIAGLSGPIPDGVTANSFKQQPVSTSQLQQDVYNGGLTLDGQQAYQGDAYSTPDSAQAPVYRDSYGNSYSSAAAAQQADAAVEQQKATINSALGRIPNQLNIANDNINDQYDQKYGGLQSGLKQAGADYQTGVTTNQQSKLGNINQINHGAYSNLQSLLRLLGGLGAGGGSEARFLVPGLVGRQAAQQTGGAQTTYAQNGQHLDTNFNNYKNDEHGKELQLKDWRTQQLNRAESTADTNKQSLLEKLAQLQPSTAQAQPFIDQINHLAGQIDGLARFKPTWGGQMPVYTAPSLDSYIVQPQAQARVQNQTQTAGTSPYLSLLLGQDKKQQVA